MICIKLTQGQHTIIESDDWERVGRHRWYALLIRRKFYAVTKISLGGGKQKLVYLHRFIIGENGRKTLVDHINGDTLDNRRINLRSCSNSENLQNRGRTVDNRSGYKGVHFSKSIHKFVARIGINKTVIRIGAFDTAEDAYIAYCEAAKRLHKQFAHF